MQKITKREYEEAKKVDPTRVQRTKKGYWKVV